jgi:hypothetical protein
LWLVAPLFGRVGPQLIARPAVAPRLGWRRNAQYGDNQGQEHLFRHDGFHGFADR